MAFTSADAAYAWVLALSLSVRIFDDLPNTEEYLETFLVAGHDGDPESGLASSSVPIERAAFERSTRDEAGTLTLAVIAQSGRSDDGDLAAARTAASEVLDELAAEIEADSTMGGATSDAWISNVDTFPGRNDAGAVVRQVVTVSYETLR